MGGSEMLEERIRVGDRMSSHASEISETKHWKSVHKCPKCGCEVDLRKLNLHETTTGIATCPTCKWPGQINLQIVPSQHSAN